MEGQDRELLGKDNPSTLLRLNILLKLQENTRFLTPDAGLGKGRRKAQFLDLDFIGSESRKEGASKLSADGGRGRG
jgi:hypothetical protein